VARQSKLILWEVDTQVDFMLPGGKLYVPGAEKLIPNIQRMVDAARENRALLVSSGDQHAPDDPEFQVFPPHCVRGSEGARVIPEGLTQKVFTVPNDPAFALAGDLTKYQQVLIEKQTLDVFDNPQTTKIVERLPAGAEFIVFGVVTEYCVRCAGKGLLDRGRRVSIVTDAIEPLDAAAGSKALEELTAAGARLMTTEEALARLNAVNAAA
jgi:nicotinamidase/pyrazinamidase